MMRTDGYLLDHRQAETGQGPDAFATLFDPTTFRHMEGFGLGSGWRCWEVGPGGTSVVSWLAKKVGPTGKVMATDTDISWAVPSVTRPRSRLSSTTWASTSRRGTASTSFTPGSPWPMRRTPSGRCCR